MEKETRNAIQYATQKARRLLEEDFREQLEGVYDVHIDGAVAAKGGPHLTGRQHQLRETIVAAIEHKRAAAMKSDQAVLDYLRDAAFTTLNRFVALKMLEGREIVQECITRGDASTGFNEFCGLAPGVRFPDGSGYRLYLECIFDELSTEVKVLFDRRDPSSVLWPKRATFDQLLELLNAPVLAGVWGEDETIGWVYQFFNSTEERRKMRDESQAPRNGRELAVRNQFFTPRYVVQFLSDNTLGRIWYEMRDGQTLLKELCEYMVRRPDETWEPRAKKDPRDIRILDPACGSGHFLLYCFDLLLVMYEEAWADAASPASEVSGETLREDYPEIANLRAALPGLILADNLHGVDIDPRCAQIGQLALWMRAQRAFRDFGIGRAERPIIKRANIVIAEPMPGEKDLLKEFLAELKEEKLEGLIRRALHIPSDKKVHATKAMADSLAELVETVWDGMKLAGEMGTLLKIERDLARAIEKGRAEWEDTLPLFRVADYGLGGITSEKLVRVVPREQEDFWTKAEKLVFQALADYVTAASSSSNARRRLFAEDAVQGFALANLVARKFHVVLMNPPFGAGSLRAKMVFDAGYPRSKQDVFAAFVERGIELLHSRGRLGAITSRTGFFLASFANWRAALLKEAPPAVFADLGLGVMDAALVEAAAYCLEGMEFSRPAPTVFLRVLEELEDKVSALKRAVVTPEVPGAHKRFEVDAATFASVPGSPFAYWVSDSLRDVFRRVPPFESNGRVARQGLATADDFRFIRAWWAVPPDELGTRWCLFAKGGKYSPFYSDLNLCVKWEDDGRDVQGYEKAFPRNTHLYFRPGLTWPLRTKSELGFRVMPRGCAFGHKGPAAVVEDDSEAELLAILALTTSKAFRSLVEFQLAAADAKAGGAARSYEVGVIQRTPVPTVPPESCALLSRLARRAWSLKRRLDSANECSHAFLIPTPLNERVTKTDLGVVKHELDEIQRQIDEFSFRLYDIDDGDRESIEASFARVDDGALGGENGGGDELDDDADDDAGPTAELSSFALNSWFIGVAFGRFDLRLATGERTFPPEPEPFDQLPSRSPGMWPEGEDPADRPDILVDDEGHARDLTALVRQSAERVAVEVPSGLRPWLARDFFPLHIKMYSKSRRKAPIYWQLATPSASYSVWLYIHAFTKDTLFRVPNDYVAPKLAHEERQLETLRAEAGPSPVAAQHKAIESQEALVEELRAFLDEVKRVAPLWNPNLDDGVIINFAPLWRLVPQLKSWQKELKTTWAALCAGEYDWAHLAMHLWPERVLPKCAEDRSLSIAHDLEDVFWYQDDDEKWKPREKPTTPIDALVKKRTSPAVKAALKSLMEAPEPTGATRRSRRGRAQ